jgi:hypothetical protein
MQPTASEFETALERVLRNDTKLVQNGIAMLCKHYYAEGHASSPEDLAKAIGKDVYTVANTQYGSFAHLLCDEMKFQPEEVGEEGNPRWTYVLATYPGKKNAKGHGLWVLRPHVVAALEALHLVRKRSDTTPMEDIVTGKPILDALSATSREQMILARVGQGAFRERLIGFWGGCAVTGCEMVELLVASHIKPWRECDYADALTATNGLLLLPNLDKAFDRGYVSFDDSGEIILSPRLQNADAAYLGIESGMTLRKTLNEEQRHYMLYHRTHIFLSI